MQLTSLGRMRRAAARLEGLPLDHLRRDVGAGARTGSVNLGQGFPDQSTGRPR